MESLLCAAGAEDEVVTKVLACCHALLVVGAAELTVGQRARLEGPWRPSTLAGGLAAREAEALRRCVQSHHDQS